MNFGVPCIAFDVDVGPREIIQDGKNGFLIENRNVDLMIKKLDEILENIDKRKNMQVYAQETSEKFYAKNVIERWYNLFK